MGSLTQPGSQHHLTLPKKGSTNMSTRVLRFILTLSIAVMALVACAPAGPQTVNVSLTTYTMKITPETIKTGDVKFVVKNDATDLVHEFFLVKTDLAPDKLPLDSEGRVNEDSPQIKEVGAAEDIDPGKSGEFSVKLEPGHYVYFCNVGTHYAIGMRGEFTIAP
jgi:uncharacterized cupredoxin-like copper-binding protein